MYSLSIITTTLAFAYIDLSLSRFTPTPLQNVFKPAQGKIPTPIHPVSQWERMHGNISINGDYRRHNGFSQWDKKSSEIDTKIDGEVKNVQILGNNTITIYFGYIQKRTGIMIIIQKGLHMEKVKYKSNGIIS